MGKLAEHAEEAFSYLDNGDIVGFTKRIIDIADYSVQSKKHRKAFDEFVEEHFKLREDLVESFKKGVKESGLKENKAYKRANPSTSNAPTVGTSRSKSPSRTKSSLEGSSVPRLQEGSTKRGRPRPSKRERMQQ